MILALDQGTTSSRAIVFDRNGAIRAAAQKELTQIFPKAGWVEHDPQEIWTSQVEVAAEALERAGLRAHDVEAIGITNQRETTVVWDRATGEPIHHAIVWQDRRTAEFCERLKADGAGPAVLRKTGLVIDAYFSATKIRWILDHVPGARERAAAGRLAFGTIDSWLVWKLTGGAQHVTDTSNASRTMLFDIRALAWDDELLRLFDVPRSMLPEVRASSEVYGQATTSGVRDVPIAGIAGDQQAALFGQMCRRPGMSKNTYGTGCFLLQNIGAEPTLSRQRLVTTVAWTIGTHTDYALEGSVFIGGAVVQWLRDGLGLVRTAADVEPLALSVPDNGGVYLVPAFAGLGAPHWDPFARGTIVGLTRGATAGHIARAALEGIAFQVADLLDAMHADSGIALTELRVDGGAATNNTLMQIQADLVGVPVVRPAITETTALGAAYLAGLAVGYWTSPDDITGQWRVDRRFEPRMAEADRRALRGRWSDAVERSKRWEVS
ncbi:MAG: glycerol kinase [Acidobacteria bacterium RIFCSPLOWO2_02_FULL_65_29]|nr:MAG: glycerol kinase [Acidobacteria bacterium RIFCSPLOWO2_02_FULL_65_29]